MQTGRGRRVQSSTVTAIASSQSPHQILTQLPTFPLPSLVQHWTIALLQLTTLSTLLRVQASAAGVIICALVQPNAPVSMDAL